ncbi:MAG: hypothetical protein IJC07_02660 [Clostridia bacterium]|nr:hypothetical protein [Clostridia bacterium]
MDTKENVHQGHRARMIAKTLANASALLDHEKLEVLLFYALPRKDTNPLAHKILKRFGTLDGVFNASAEDLKMVEGVGDSVAGYLVTVGSIMRAMLKQEEADVYLKKFDQSKVLAEKLFKGSMAERFFLLLLNKNKKVIARIQFDDDNKNTVSADIPDISRALYLHKPDFAIIMHNHPSGVAIPSREDDLSTKKINLLCELVGTNLIDHIVYADGEMYSYWQNGRMSEIKRSADVNKVLNSVKGDM